jgi:hypothetical protein
MTIEELWKEIEAEAAADDGTAWLLRRATAAPGHPLLVALEPATRIRTLLVPAAKSEVPPRRDWPECRGLELQIVSIAGATHLAVRLRDAASADVFTALADDVAPRVAAATRTVDAVTALLGRLRRWQQFLAAAQVGLSREEERGLWGELHTLKTHLIASLGAAEAVAAWKAGSAAHQDFQCPAGALEVKTTAAKQPQSVRITSERQLDDTGVGELFLHVVAIDEREVAPVGTAPGTSLPVLVGELRIVLAATATLAVFEDRLMECGYFDLHAPRYEGRRRTVRSEQTFRVAEGFPRLTETMLPPGVGDTSYAVSLAACAPFSTGIPEMLAAISNSKKP